MIATFNEFEVRNVTPSAFAARDSQALIKQLSIIAIINDDIQELVTARFYKSSRRDANRVTCILWIHGGTTAGYVAASGTAKGYGYHMTSMALQDALDSAHIELSDHISGMGEKAMADALLAVAKAARPEATRFKVFEAHN